MTPANTSVYRRRNHHERTVINTVPSTNTAYLASDSNPVVTVEIGDGAGSDSTQGMAAPQMNTDYAFGMELSDFHIVSPNTVDVEVYYYHNGSWTLAETISLTGTAGSPDHAFREGNSGFGVAGNIANDSGAAAYFQSGGTDIKLWWFKGDNPFMITINDTSDDEEILVGFSEASSPVSVTPTPTPTSNIPFAPMEYRRYTDVKHQAFGASHMSLNTFGHLFRVTTWGESHGPALGATIDGCPPGVDINAADLQHWLDKRKPGQNKFTTQRREPDAVEILSGVFEGKSTGTPIQLMIQNTDQRSKDYGNIAETFRPGHADITYWQKYGIRDYRGGGRSSARETAARVAAGGVARAALKTLAPNLQITGYMTQIGPHKIDPNNFDWDQIDQNEFWTPDAQAAQDWATYLDDIRKSHDSVGGVIEVVARNAPAGLGAPIYGKLDTDLAAAMMSINAVKGVEIGQGMNAAALTGSENADEIFMGNDGQPVYSSNNAGGILGGISTGQDIVVRFAVKPTSSILTPRQSITKSGDPIEVVTKGRHDPCVGIRAVPVGEAMMACVLLDHVLLHRGQIGENRGKIGK